jgi:hypothetical protein
MRLPHGENSPALRWYKLASIVWAIKVRKSSLAIFPLFYFGKRYGVFLVREDRSKEEYGLD